MSKLIINVETGETTESELNKAEKNQQKVDEANCAKRNAEAKIKEAAKLAILDRLGLTADEFQTILG